mgnify:CR=1 FL=1
MMDEEERKTAARLTGSEPAGPGPAPYTHPTLPTLFRCESPALPAA